MKNVLVVKSYDFAVKIVKLYKHLSQEKKEFVLSKQFLRSGTSIVANIEEAIGGYSKRDFKAQLSIAYKESRETKYWLRLLKDTDFLRESEFQPLHSNCDELSKMLYKSIDSVKF